MEEVKEMVVAEGTEGAVEVQENVDECSVAVVELNTPKMLTDGKTVFISSSSFTKSVNAKVTRDLESWFIDFAQSKRYAKYYADRGIHYVFLMMEVDEDGEHEKFRVDACTPGAHDLYADAKLEQLLAFPELSHTGGETIADVRAMLAKKGDSESAETFYVEYRPEDPIDVICDDTAKWLRDKYGIAPWYGALKFPYSIKVFGDGSDSHNKSGYIVTAFSGCTNSQEDLFFNISLTDDILETFATDWSEDVIKLDLVDLRECAVTETVLKWMNFNEIVMPKDNSKR